MSKDQKFLIKTSKGKEFIVVDYKIYGTHDRYMEFIDIHGRKGLIPFHNLDSMIEIKE